MSDADGIIRSVKQKGRGLSVRFGTDILKDLSDRQFPAEVWRIYEMVDGSKAEEHGGTVTKAERVQAMVRKVGGGARAGSKKSWVELRTPASRS